jgi:integrase
MEPEPGSAESILKADSPAKRYDDAGANAHGGRAGGVLPMRQGSIYRRCSKCGRVVQDGKARRCPQCGGERITWAYAVDVAPPGAKREVRYRSGFTTKREAVEAMARLQTERADGTYVEPSTVTLGEYLEYWLAGGPARGWRANTARDYRVGVKHIKDQLADVRLQSLNSAQVAGLYGHLLREGRVRIRKDPRTGAVTVAREGLSKKSVANVHICLRAALNDAVDADPPLLRRNPAAGAFTYSRTKDRVEMLTWSAEEIQRFLGFTADDPDSALYRTAVMTGMRRGELLGLRRRDLDLEAVVDGQPGPRLNVRQQWTKNGDVGLRRLSLKTGTKAWRTIDLDGGTADALRGHLGAQEFQRHSWGAAYGRGCPRCARRVQGRCPECGPAPIDLDLVFARADGLPQDPDVVTRRFERRARECVGVRDIRFHDQRHTHATLLLENGESIKYVAERLGDREDTVLETYAHVTSRMRSGAVSRLAALLDPAPSPVGIAEGGPLTR